MNGSLVLQIEGPIETDTLLKCPMYYAAPNKTMQTIGKDERDVLFDSLDDMSNEIDLSESWINQHWYPLKELHYWRRIRILQRLEESKKQSPVLQKIIWRECNLILCIDSKGGRVDTMEMIQMLQKCIHWKGGQVTHYAGRDLSSAAAEIYSFPVAKRLASKSTKLMFHLDSITTILNKIRTNKPLNDTEEWILEEYYLLHKSEYDDFLGNIWPNESREYKIRSIVFALSGKLLPGYSTEDINEFINKRVNSLYDSIRRAITNSSWGLDPSIEINDVVRADDTKADLPIWIRPECINRYGWDIVIADRGQLLRLFLDQVWIQSPRKIPRWIFDFFRYCDRVGIEDILSLL